ncbi:uncharacterized protein LOC121982796 [Zingiber officinale]|uniref:Uncharacterized protein n=1 Tax=Zingiber officinale TaxID=94328 RepID=A0A8J5GUM3_ZINOF|nr:uncharacterized protein LOC121982796 [Zingiber officinale]KAG6506619.1 hypothetical protein ZIOFF_031946 [Zingiber officinale]
MGDSTTSLAKARNELEDLYLGVPDESVDLSFKDLTSFQENGVTEKKVSSMVRIDEESVLEALKASPINKSPSIDFSKGLQGANKSYGVEVELFRERLLQNSFKRSSKSAAMMLERSNAYDDMSGLSMTSTAVRETGRRRQPGIPHSNICALCSIYIYIFRHRCLVCGRVYCRSCVGSGMGEMSEGRKCVECLGRRFSQRYIKRAGKALCCWRYPSRVKVQELMWAEKGPRRSGERQYRSGVSSAIRSPVSMIGSPRVASRLGSPVKMVGMPSAAAQYSIGHESSFMASPMRSPSPHAFPL